MDAPVRRKTLIFSLSPVRKTPSVSFDRAYAGARQERLGGLELRFLGLKDFIATKKASGRTKDLLDIELLKESGLWDED